MSDQKTISLRIDAEDLDKLDQLTDNLQKEMDAKAISGLKVKITRTAAIVYAINKALESR